MTATTSAPSLSGVREALRAGGVSQIGDRPGLPHLPEVETWLVDGNVILKVTVAPEDRPGAQTIPARVHDALRSGDFILVPDDGAPAPVPAAAALASGRAVRVVSRHWPLPRSGPGPDLPSRAGASRLCRAMRKPRCDTARTGRAGARVRAQKGTT